MRPLFTIHAGEYIAGSFIEQRFPRCRVWIPSRDTGIDLLVTDNACARSVKLQVKFSKDFAPTHYGDSYKNKLKVSTWFRFAADSLRHSEADYWTLVLQSFVHAKPEFLVINPADLLAQISRLHGAKSHYDLYFWVNSAGRCWETRGLRANERKQAADDSLVVPHRDFSKYLNNWSPLDRLNGER
jgi:hypothetical protein